jgi:DNA-binding NtrC family response regulator
LNQRPSIIRNRIVSIACLPLQVEDRLLGYLYLDSREGVESLATTESTLLDIFASVVALILNNSMILERSLQANDSMRASLGLKDEFPEIVGTSPLMLDLLKSVHQLLDSDFPVLVTGETGTGKELIARVLHYCGKRRAGPFVAINSAALTEGLLESELFGHEKGSFTGATQMRKGLFEEARDGTLFLDEIGDMPRATQAKFLRVLQDGEFRRVGGNQILHSNARVVLATNRNLLEMVDQKQFREDLYYRVLGAQLHVPPLRDRQDDIPVLAAHFLRTAAGAARKKVRGISPEAMDVLKRCSWPGNVRQLKSEIERIVAMIDHEWILESDISKLTRDLSVIPATEASLPGGPLLKDVEREVILSRLKAYEWNIQLTARSLGLTRNGLYSKMKLYGISKGLSH